MSSLGSADIEVDSKASDWCKPNLKEAGLYVYKVDEGDEEDEDEDQVFVVISRRDLALHMLDSIDRFEGYD